MFAPASLFLLVSFCAVLLSNVPQILASASLPPIPSASASFSSSCSSESVICIGGQPLLFHQGSGDEQQTFAYNAECKFGPPLPKAHTSKVHV